MSKIEKDRCCELLLERMSKKGKVKQSKTKTLATVLCGACANYTPDLGRGMIGPRAYGKGLEWPIMPLPLVWIVYLRCSEAVSKRLVISIRTSVSFLGTNGSSHTLDVRSDRSGVRSCFGGVDLKTSASLLTVRQSSHHRASSRFSMTVVWFTSMNISWWRRKVTERSSLLCEWKLQCSTAKLRSV